MNKRVAILSFSVISTALVAMNSVDSYHKAQKTWLSDGMKPFMDEVQKMAGCFNCYRPQKHEHSPRSRSRVQNLLNQELRHARFQNKDYGVVDVHWPKARLSIAAWVLTGADPNYREKRFFIVPEWEPTVLYDAVKNKDYQLVRFLLEHGAKQNLGHYPLLGGICDVTKIAKELIKHGADVNARHPYWCTPLHYAMMHDSDGTLTDALIDAGAKVNTIDREKCTPLHRLAFCNSRYVRYDLLIMKARLLLNAGADRDALTCAGETALDVAKRKAIATYYKDTRLSAVIRKFADFLAQAGKE